MDPLGKIYLQQSAGWITSMSPPEPLSSRTHERQTNQAEVLCGTGNIGPHCWVLSGVRGEVTGGAVNAKSLPSAADCM